MAIIDTINQAVIDSMFAQDLRYLGFRSEVDGGICLIVVCRGVPMPYRFFVATFVRQLSTSDEWDGGQRNAARNHTELSSLWNALRVPRSLTESVEDADIFEPGGSSNIIYNAVCDHINDQKHTLSNANSRVSYDQFKELIRTMFLDAQAAIDSAEVVNAFPEDWSIFYLRQEPETEQVAQAA